MFAWVIDSIICPCWNKRKIHYFDHKSHMRLLVVRMHISLRTPRDLMLMILVHSCPVLVEWFPINSCEFYFSLFTFCWVIFTKKKKKINILCFSSFIIFYCWSHYSCFGYLLGHQLHGWWHVGWYTWDMILVILGCVGHFRMHLSLSS